MKSVAMGEREDGEGGTRGKWQKGMIQVPIIDSRYVSYLYELVSAQKARFMLWLLLLSSSASSPFHEAELQDIHYSLIHCSSERPQNMQRIA
jgi:hypothetical protein